MANLINIKFGKRIKELRKKRGLTQEELAEQTKTSYKYIQRIEGKNPPDIRLSTAERIATALKTDISKLLQ
jgi:transcriptional regulator with XRE-family HTH domain